MVREILHLLVYIFKSGKYLHGFLVTATIVALSPKLLKCCSYFAVFIVTAQIGSEINSIFTISTNSCIIASNFLRGIDLCSLSALSFAKVSPWSPGGRFFEKISFAKKTFESTQLFFFEIQ
jgi:hypothetical protein